MLIGLQFVPFSRMVAWRLIILKNGDLKVNNMYHENSDYLLKLSIAGNLSTDNVFVPHFVCNIYQSHSVDNIDYKKIIK